MRLWLKRLALAALGAAALYLGGVNLLLNSSLGHRLANPRPQRVEIDWQRAWSLWPGDLRMTGLAVEGHTRRVGWRLAVDRARARIELTGLFQRRLHVVELRGEGVEERTWTEEAAELAPRPPSRHPWTLQFDGVVLDRVRELGHGEFRLVGVGNAEGGFTTTIGGEFTLPAGRIEMAAGRLLLANDEVAGDFDLGAELTVAPYAPRLHPGAEGLDFVSGTLTANGSVPEWPRLARLQDAPDAQPAQPAAPAEQAEPASPAEPAEPGAFAAALRLDAGALEPGSRISLRAPRTAAGEPFTATLEVAAADGPPRLVIALDAPGFTIPRRGGGPPWLTAAALEVTAETAERRLARLLASARGLGASVDGAGNADATGAGGAAGAAGNADDAAADAGLGPLRGNFAATGLTLTTGRRLIWRLGIDRASGTIDLPALLRREVRLAAVRGGGVVSVMTPVPQPGAAVATAATANTRRWAVTLTDAALDDVREVTVGTSTIAGAGTLAGDLAYAADGTLAVPAAVLAMPAGRVQVAGRDAARRIDLRLTGRVAPFTPGELTGAAALRVFSGTLTARGRVDSLGFLSRYLAKTPGLTVAGSGQLDGELRIEAGRLLPGSQFEVPAAKVAATILDDVATGTARVSGRVADEPGGPRARVAVEFERFNLAPADGAGRAFLRGRGLRVAAVSAALDLAAPAADVQAEIDLADSEVPDLRVYNAYFPDQAGLAFLGGSGRLRLHLALDGERQTAAGEVVLTSDAFRLQFKDQAIAGRLTLHTRLASPDLGARRFDLDGTRLDIDRVRLRGDAGDDSGADDWWAHVTLPKASMVWSKPLALDGTIDVRMKDADLLFSLFAQRKRYLRWFADALKLEDLAAEGRVKLAANAIEIDPFTATGGSLTLRSRLRFAKGSQRGDLLVRYGVVAVGVELRDGERNFKFLRPQRWFEGRTGFD